MKKKGFLLILLLVTSGTCVPTVAQHPHPTNSPDGVIREMYRVHNGGKGGIFDARGRKYIYKFFDQRLADLLWRDITKTPEGEVGNLDFDPLYNAQDIKVTNFQVGKPVVEGDQAAVIVSFLNYGQRTRIKIRMAKGKGGWKIENLIYSDSSDLVKILSMPQ